jgi:regulator of protease activity HflC (stomatin/prohibitin superfamily)
MLVIRILLMFSGFAVVGSLFAWALTRDGKYLQFAGRVAKGALFLVLAILALLAAERLLIL